MKAEKFKEIITCKENIFLDLEVRLFEMSRMLFSQMREPDQRAIVNLYNHMSSCEKCSQAYCFLKEKYSSEEVYADQFRPYHFKQIRENEQTLKELAQNSK